MVKTEQAREMMEMFQKEIHVLTAQSAVLQKTIDERHAELEVIEGKRTLLSDLVEKLSYIVDGTLPEKVAY